VAIVYRSWTHASRSKRTVKSDNIIPRDFIDVRAVVHDIEKLVDRELIDLGSLVRSSIEGRLEEAPILTGKD
jgi:hypothetical protein